MKPLIKVILVFSTFLIAAQFFQDELVFQRNDISSGEWWRIISGNLTHSNNAHLFLNLSGLWIFCFLFIDSLNAKTFIASSFLLSIIVGLGLYFFNPELHRYYGFSGALYGLFICGGTGAILQKDFFTGIATIILVTGKITWDFFNGGSATSADLIGIPVAVDAHLYGVSGAFIISLFLIFQHFYKKRMDTPPVF